MTFKHVKFEDSAVMRSLERMAREKGLVPDKSARVKTASAPDLDFPEGSTLMENILRLCAGLRHAGFEKHAQEVEEKFLAFKQAQTLYETSSEKGEDLVDAAHPKGSHKLEDVAGDDLAVVETIIDQHLKHLKMINKEPTGKLANNNSILSAVKTVLAQAQEESDTLNNNLRNEISKLLSVLRKMDTLTSDELNVSIGSGYLPNIENLVNNPTLDNLKEAKKRISKLRWRLKPGSVFGLSEDTWAQVEPLQGAVEAAIDSAINLRSQIVQLKSKTNTEQAQPAQPSQQKPAEVTPFQAALNHLDALREKIEGWLMYGVIRKNPVASKWITDEANALKALKDTFSKATPAQQAGALAQLQKETATEEKDINDFESKWIRG